MSLLDISKIVYLRGQGSSLNLTEEIVIRNVKLKIYQLFVGREKEPYDRYIMVKLV
jgi:hypothetical protein